MNITAQARCFYIDGSTDPFTGRPRWQVTDFSIVLTRQQPTHWVVSRGRPVDPSDVLGQQNSGIDPGAVPPVVPGFEGELRCVVVDVNDNPLPLANWLKGSATIRSNTLDVSEYNAIALKAGELAGIEGNVLTLDQVGKATDGQYSSCPETLLLDFTAFGQVDTVVRDLGLCVGNDCPVETSLTLIPCSANYENLIPGRVSLFIEVINEFENTLSAVTTIECWTDTPLDIIGGGGASLNNPFVASVLGSPTGLARITPTDGQGGVLGVVEEAHLDSSANVGHAAFNLQHEGSRALVLPFEDFDSIVLSGH
jgi:hypothetical protein